MDEGPGSYVYDICVPLCSNRIAKVALHVLVYCNMITIRRQVVYKCEGLILVFRQHAYAVCSSLSRCKGRGGEEKCNEYAYVARLFL